MLFFPPFLWNPVGVRGHSLIALSFMLLFRSVEPEYASTAGMFGAASIVTGIFAGIGFSYLMPVLISNPNLDFEEPSWWPAFSG